MFSFDFSIPARWETEAEPVPFLRIPQPQRRTFLNIIEADGPFLSGSEKNLPKRVKGPSWEAAIREG